MAALTAAEAGHGLFLRAIAQSVAHAFLPEEKGEADQRRDREQARSELSAEAFVRLGPVAIHEVQAVPGEITPFGP